MVETKTLSYTQERELGQKSYNAEKTWKSQKRTQNGYWRNHYSWEKIEKIDAQKNFCSTLSPTVRDWNPRVLFLLSIDVQTLWDALLLKSQLINLTTAKCAASTLKTKLSRRKLWTYPVYPLKPWLVCARENWVWITWKQQFYVDFWSIFGQ